jgi:ATP-dependent helicase/nuclease subunit A
MTLTPFEETVRNQRRVSAPETSAWVAANAGAGKTKVLTDRVMRLLLTGVPPSRILSITFTKAAAAEMADRLFQRLGEWALLDDEALREQLYELDNEKTRSTEEISVARRLFARALETPGGLKIQTIHSFCESVLKRFPLEAGIAPGFRVMEETESDALLYEIVSTFALQSLEIEGDAPIAGDFALLNEALGEDVLRSNLYALARRGLEISRAIAEAGGVTSFLNNLAEMLAVDPAWDEETLIDEYQLALDADFLESAFSALASGSKTDMERADALRTLLDATDLEDIWQASFDLFMTTAGTPRKSLATKQADSNLPGVKDRLVQVQETFLQLEEKRKGVALFGITTALYRLAIATYAQYTSEKRTRGLLDFDDLISKTASLFHDTSADWVLYKMDQEITHILVDEAQDTSDSQWRVIEGPLQEFFAGLGAAEENRTVFVVGDEKQSIYSFQGANVDLFREKQGALFGLVTTAEKPFLVEDLVLSFRSSQAVLSFVDAAFEAPGAAKGVSELAEMRHIPNRAGAAGQVELWPLVLRSEKEDGNPWDAPVDMPDVAHPARQLARHITGTIKSWLDEKKLLPARGRPVEPRDIMILCQSRGTIFQELVRELALQGVPTAGADRIKLMENIAVQDLVSATKFAVQSADDLSLAEVLKSPLFGFTDEDLFLLTREETATTLWKKLTLYSGEDDMLAQKCQYAQATLRRARTAGMLRGAHAFYMSLLEEGQPSGWQRFYSRLGEAAREPLQEFLNEALEYENTHPRTLQGFLQHVASLTTELKREIDGSDNLVRIMTVHGSKGLEADIVFLADATQANFARIDGLLPIGPLPEQAPQAYEKQYGYYAYSGAKSTDNPATERAREAAIAERAEEYRRLFYVAATRARDQLYICGTQIGRTKPESMLTKPDEEASWYALATRAFEKLDTVEAGEAPWGGVILRHATEQTDSVPDHVKSAPTQEPSLPEWLYEPAPREKTIRRISPSHLEVYDEAALITPAEEISYSPVTQAGAYSPFTRGNALHLLLEKLPDVPMEARAAVAAEMLQKQFADIEENDRQAWVSEVLAVLEEPAFAAVFGPGSRAEVSLLGQLGEGGEAPIVSGQIDRLCVLDDKVLIVDYKTNRPPPDKIADVPASYIGQLAAYRGLLQKIYQGKEVHCALLWTWDCRLMPIPQQVLDHAYVHSLVGPNAENQA